MEMIDQARSEGVDITMDRYPYTAANTTLRSVLPPWMQEGGIDALLKRLQDPDSKRKCAEEMGDEYNWDTMYVNGCRVHQDLNGKSVAEIAKIWWRTFWQPMSMTAIDLHGMEEALRELARLRRGRAIAVLGDMLELGVHAGDAHAHLVEKLNQQA
jgi:N-acyl-D-aspartate/D-glutamate deacylase